MTGVYEVELRDISERYSTIRAKKSFQVRTHYLLQVDTRCVLALL